MSDHQLSFEPSEASPTERALLRLKRLVGPTLGIFGLDSEGHLLPPSDTPGVEAAARVREANERDDHARIAIAGAELATERSEKQQAASRPAPSSR